MLEDSPYRSGSSFTRQRTLKSPGKLSTHPESKLLSSQSLKKVIPEISQISQNIPLEASHPTEAVDDGTPYGLCGCGPNYYSNLLGPTIDESILNCVEKFISSMQNYGGRCLPTCAEKPITESAKASTRSVSMQTSLTPEILSEILQSAGILPELASAMVQTSLRSLPLSMQSEIIQTSTPEMLSKILQTSGLLSIMSDENSQEEEVNEPSLKEPSKEPSKESSRSPWKEPSKESSRSPWKEPSKESSRSPWKEPSKESSRSPSKEPSKESSRSPWKEPSKESSRSPWKEPSKESSRSPWKEPSKESSRSPWKEPSEESATSPWKEPSRESSRSPWKEPSEKSTKDPWKEPSKEPSEESYKEPSINEPTPEPSLEKEDSYESLREPSKIFSNLSQESVKEPSKISIHDNNMKMCACCKCLEEVQSTVFQPSSCLTDQSEKKYLCCFCNTQLHKYHRHLSASRSKLSALPQMKESLFAWCRKKKMEKVKCSCKNCLKPSRVCCNSRRIDESEAILPNSEKLCVCCPCFKKADESKYSLRSARGSSSRKLSLSKRDLSAMISASGDKNSLNGSISKRESPLSLNSARSSVESLAAEKGSIPDFALEEASGLTKKRSESLGEAFVQASTSKHSTRRSSVSTKHLEDETSRRSAKSRSSSSDKQSKQNSEKPVRKVCACCKCLKPVENERSRPCRSNLKRRCSPHPKCERLRKCSRGNLDDRNAACRRNRRVEKRPVMFFEWLCNFFWPKKQNCCHACHRPPVVSNFSSGKENKSSRLKIARCECGGGSSFGLSNQKSKTNTETRTQ